MPRSDRPSVMERAATAQEAGARAPLDGLGEFQPAADRDPIGLLLEQATTRVPELVPVRHGRMLVSPFAYFRGAALPMAADLAALPSSGLWVQLCGDAHLSNFGAYASPERRLLFGINDFDETLPGPFEWDLKRLAASIAVAGRENGFSAKDRRGVIVAAIHRYRSAMVEFAAMPLLEVWYAHLDVEDLFAKTRSRLTRRGVRRVEEAIAKAHTRDNLQVFHKMTHVVDGVRQIVPNPPLVVPLEDASTLDREGVYEWVRNQVQLYRNSLQGDRRFLMERYRLVHAARKVVGVGSVGTRAYILLFEANDGSVLFLQYKEAQASALSGFLGASQFGNHGQRVVEGQRLIQAVSDIFLGWQRVEMDEGVLHPGDRRSLPGGRTDYYVRQLRDWKFSEAIEELQPVGMAMYGMLCAWTLARAHARTGDRFSLAEYMGRSDRFEHALADFAETYADQNERDYAAFTDAVATGRVEAVRGL